MPDTTDNTEPRRLHGRAYAALAALLLPAAWAVLAVAGVPARALAAAALGAGGLAAVAIVHAQRRAQAARDRLRAAFQAELQAMADRVTAATEAATDARREAAATRLEAHATLVAAATHARTAQASAAAFGLALDRRDRRQAELLAASVSRLEAFETEVQSLAADLAVLEARLRQPPAWPAPGPTVATPAGAGVTLKPAASGVAPAPQSSAPRGLPAPSIEAGRAFLARPRVGLDTEREPAADQAQALRWGGINLALALEHARAQLPTVAAPALTALDARVAELQQALTAAADALEAAAAAAAPALPCPGCAAHEAQRRAWQDAVEAHRSWVGELQRVLAPMVASVAALADACALEAGALRGVATHLGDDAAHGRQQLETLGNAIESVTSVVAAGADAASVTPSAG